MKAMVLAAGLGVRMRPLTLVRAKPALPVLNRPLLHWTLDLLARHGVRDVVVNLHHLPGTVRRALGDGSAFGLRVRYSLERRILGTGGGPRKARPLLGEGPVLIVNGDVLFDFDLEALMREHRRRGAWATLGLLPNPDPRRYSAVLTGRDRRIRSFRGGPGARGASLFAGVHVVEAALLGRLPPGRSDIVRDLYAPLVQAAAPVHGVRLRGAWYDFGSPPLYLASQLSLLASGFGGLAGTSLVDPAARVAPGARVVRSVVGAGAVLDEGAEVRDSVLWPGVRVGRGARVRRSILAAGVRVRAGAEVEGRIGLRRRGRQRFTEVG